MRFVVTMLVLLFATSVALAQPKAGLPPDRSDAIKKRIRSLRAYTLTEELRLDEKTAGKLFPMLSKWDELTDKLLAQRAELTRQLRASDLIKDPKALDRLIDDSIANQKAFWDLEDRRLAELRKILSPAQTAKLLVVLPTFERRIQNQLRKATLRRARTPATDGEDVDDDVDPDDRRGLPPAKRPPVPPRG